MGAAAIANALSAARKAVRLYPQEHPTHREAVAALCAAVTETVDVRPLSLNLREGRLYEGSDVLTDASPATRALAEAMEVRRVESLTFHMGFTETDARGLGEVLSLRPSPDLQVTEELEARDVRGVTVSELEDNSSLQAEERARRREADRALYRQALSALKTITTALAEGNTVETVEANRALALLVERVGEDPHAILALAHMSGHGDRWRFHAVSVMLRSLVIGHAFGLADRDLLTLGLAGLMHDVGSVLPSEIDVATAYSAHPVSGAQALGDLLDESCAAMIVAYEHHMGVDGSGWPERPAEYATHPYTRIVAVADRYDDLIRPSEERALRPDEAIVRLLGEASGGPLDPVITRRFIQTIGVIPVASVVRLSDHSIGIVRMPGSDPMRPQLRLTLAADGTALRPAADLDLTEDERSIVEIVAAELLGMQPSDYL